MQEVGFQSDYGQLSDEELVALYKQGVQDAFGELSVRYIVVIRNRSAGLYNMGVEAEDLFQEGLIALHTAVTTYREDDGASFCTYASKCIRNRLISAVRKVNNNKNRINNIAVSLDCQSDNQCDPMTDPERVLMADEEVRELLELAHDNLSDMEMRVLALYIDGKSYDEISGELGIPVKSCDNAMQRVRKKLRELYR